ncbi:MULTISPECIES: restriction endonuclease subunit S [Dethiosulfovibrio]|nr:MULTISPECIES: restriction endonuclease subunit S [Dethiosulfovibrio]MCF4141315.1 restriction endonuclease subunit S [Dethiosulfovibrio marinus]
MTVEKGYKVTEVGVIPEEWEACQLKDISDFITKGATPTTYGFDWQDEGILFLKSDCITPSGFSYGQCKFISAEAHRSMKRSVVKAGDILMSITGYIGKVAVVPEYVEEANINQHIARIRVTSSKHDSRFTYYSLLAPGQTKLLVKDCTGQAYPQLSLEQVRNVTIYAPPLPEQEKISEVLSTVDEHIGETEDLIEQTETLKKGMMQRLLTQGIGHTKFKDTEIGRIPAEWEVCTLTNIASVIMGQSPASESYNDKQKGLPFYQGNADFGEKYPTTRVWCSSPSKIVPEGSILISVRAPVGAINISDTISCIGRGLAGIKIESDITQSYIYFYLQQHRSRLAKVSQGSTFLAIGSTELKEFLLALPTYSEQRDIADILTAIDDRIGEYRAKLEALTRLKSGLMQQLLTGKTRVRV